MLGTLWGFLTFAVTAVVGIGAFAIAREFVRQLFQELRDE